MNTNISTPPLKRTSGGRHRRFRFCSTIAMALALALSGAGLVVGGSAASASSKTSTKSLKKFESCLKKHGVKSSFPGAGHPPNGGAPSGTFPSGGGAAGGFKGNAKMQKALKACSSFLPAGSKFGGGPGSGSAANLSTAFAAFRNCMTLNHVTLAKGAYGNTKKSSAVTLTTSSTYKKAYSACSALLPKTPPKSS